MNAVDVLAAVLRPRCATIAQERSTATAIVDALAAAGYRIVPAEGEVIAIPDEVGFDDRDEWAAKLIAANIGTSRTDDAVRASVLADVTGDNYARQELRRLATEVERNLRTILVHTLGSLHDLHAGRLPDATTSGTDQARRRLAESVPRLEGFLDALVWRTGITHRHHLEEAEGLHLVATEADVRILVPGDFRDDPVLEVPIDNPHSCILDTSVRCLACEGIGLRMTPPVSAPST